MELSQLIQFKEVVECGSISKAAEKLYMSQPAVSKNLQRLEEDLGTNLFIRTGNKLELRPEGKSALARVNHILDEVEALRSDLHYSVHSGSVVRIVSPANAILRHNISGYMSSQHDVMVTSSLRDQSELYDLLIGGDIDLAFSIEAFNDNRITNILFDQEKLVVSAPLQHPLAAHDTLTIRDLDGFTFLTQPNTGILQQKQNELMQLNGVTINEVQQNDYMIYREMCKTTNLLYFFSTIAQRFYDRSDNRKSIVIDEDELHLTYYISCRNEDLARLAPVIEWFCKHRETHALDSN